jgi:desulfoferrodoxin (superoxide reductase-like protein)
MMKYKKYLTFIVIFFLCSTILGIQGNATSPRYIGINYKQQTQTLKVTIIHFSPAVNIHYVYRVVIEKNGEVQQSHLYQKQPSIIFNTYTYNISAGPSDVLTVSAYCNLFGYLSKSQKIVTCITSLTIP